MRKTTILKEIGLYALIAVVAAVLGVTLGGMYTKGRHATAFATKLEERQRYLVSNIHDIAEGRPFPDIPFRKPDGITAVQIRGLLPQGGLVIYTSGECPSCIETVRALGEARRSLKDKASAAVIISGGDPTQIMDVVAKESINVAVVRDTQMSLSNDYGVVSFPSYFLLNSTQTIQSFGATSGTVDEFKRLLSH